MSTLTINTLCHHNKVLVCADFKPITEYSKSRCTKNRKIFFLYIKKTHTHNIMKFEQFLIPIAIIAAAMLVAKSAQSTNLNPKPVPVNQPMGDYQKRGGDK